MYFDDFFFPVLDSYRFHRPMLERQGWYSLEKDGKLLVLLNVLGIDEKDLTVDVKSAENNKEMICVNGSTKDELFDKDFSVNMNFLVGKPMEQVKTSVKNGFLTLEISFKEPVLPSVKVIRG
jgi:HSP20 family molecular chaperone IbpA